LNWLFWFASIFFSCVFASLNFFTLNAMSQSLPLSRYLPTLLAAGVSVAISVGLTACGGGSETGTPVGSSSSGGPAASSSGDTSSTSSSSSSSSSSSGATQTGVSTIKVVGGVPVDQITCGTATNTLVVSNVVANATWLNCQGGLGARVDVNPNQSQVRILYGNAAEGVVTFSSAPGSVSTTDVDYKTNLVTVKAEKLIVVDSTVGSKGTKLTVPPQISVSGVLKIQ
jgi:hypothetical protein